MESFNNSLHSELLCPVPFFELHVHYNGLTRGCCYYTGDTEEWNLEDDFDLNHYWNGPVMRRQRKNALAPKQSMFCSECIFMRIGREFPYGQPNSMMNDLQLENWQKIRDAVESRDTVVDAVPARQVWYLGSKCNISCIMCCDLHNRKDVRRIDVSLMGEMIAALKYANELLLVGGEPFCMRETRHILETVSANGIDNLLLSACTNATLLHNYLSLLKQFRRVYLGVSLDAVYKHYNKIRVGGKWPEVERNIIDFQKIGAENGRSWGMHINAVIMKSTILGLNELVDWSLERGIPCRFKPLITQPATGAEDVWKNSKILNNHPGWEKIFDICIDKLSSAGQKEEAQILNNIFQSIVNAQENFFEHAASNV